MRTMVRCMTLFWERVAKIEAVLRENGVEIPEIVRLESPETRRDLSNMRAPFKDTQGVLGWTARRGNYALEVQLYLPSWSEKDSHFIETPVNEGDDPSGEWVDMNTGTYIKEKIGRSERVAWFGEAKPEGHIWVVLRQRDDGRWGEGFQLDWEMTWNDYHYDALEWEDGHRDGTEPNHGWELCNMSEVDGFDPAALGIPLEPFYFKEEVAMSHLAIVARFFASLAPYPVFER